MDRRLKIITIAMSLVYVAIFCGFLGSVMVEFVQGFRQGFNEAWNCDSKEEMSTLSDTRTFSLSLKPENGFHSFPSVIINQLDRKLMKAEIETVVVKMSDVKNKMPKSTLIAYVCSIFLYLFALFIMVLIPVQTLRVLNSVCRDKIFNPENIIKLRIIGYSSLALYVVNLIINFFDFRTALHVVEVEGYSLQMDWGNIYLVVLGLVILMFAEVLKVSVQLKEEQDLTV